MSLYLYDIKEQIIVLKKINLNFSYYFKSNQFRSLKSIYQVLQKM